MDVICVSFSRDTSLWLAGVSGLRLLVWQTCSLVVLCQCAVKFSVGLPVCLRKLAQRCGGRIAQAGCTLSDAAMARPLLVHKGG